MTDYLPAPLAQPYRPLICQTCGASIVDGTYAVDLHTRWHAEHDAPTTAEDDRP